MLKNSSVAIIMPVFNAEKTIKRAVSSVLAQSYENFILYIIDDGSTDKSIDIVENIADDRILILKNKINKGVAFSRNIGLVSSYQDFIFFIDSDDLWEVDKLFLQLHLLEKYEIVSSSYFYVKNDTCKLIKSPSSLTKNQFLRKNYRVCFSTLAFSRKVLKDLVFENIGHEDFVFIYRLIEQSKLNKIAFVEKGLAKYFVQNESLSSAKYKAATWHWLALRTVLKFNIFKSIFLFSNYTVKAILFKFFCK